MNLRNSPETDPDPAVGTALATFSNLQKLDVYGVFRVVLAYLEGAARAGPPVKELGLKFHDNQMDLQRFSSVLSAFQESLEQLDIWSFAWELLSEEFDLEAVTLPKLKELSFEGHGQVLIPFLQRIQAPLTRLSATFLDTVNRPAFYRTLDRFGETLVGLKMYGCLYRNDIPLEMNEEDYHDIRINLPNLRVLCLYDVTGSLQPIFQLKSLTSFHVSFNRVEMEWSTRAFELVGRVIEESPSVWEMMPLLQQFSVKGNAPDGEEGWKTVEHIRGE